MALRNFDMFSGSTAQVAQALFDHVSGEFPKEVSRIWNSLASKSYQLWKATAENESPWGQRYSSILRMEPMRTDGAGGIASVWADLSDDNAMFFNMMENGVKSWNISDALLNGKRARESKNGVRYVIIPFRWRVPGKTKSTSSFAGVMSDDVYAMAQEGATVGPQYGHMAGLKKYGERGHSQYMTFRVVSESSPDWIHPGKSPTPVYQKVLAQIDRMVGTVIQKWLQAKLQEVKKYE